MPVKLNTTYISSALADKLSHISEYPVTSIVAPIGYGKTRAISWWVDHCQKKKADALILRQIIVTDSLTDFWRGFCRNLREWPELEKDMSALGFPADPQARQLMMELLTDALAGKSHDIFYIIDDLHFLPNPALTSLILFLSDHLPERTHIILLSRNVIFDRAAQMKLGPRLWELNVDDLRLGETDVREYARRSGQILNIRDVNMLASSTEGWFSMVYLKLRAYTQTGKWPENTTNIYPLIDEVLFTHQSSKIDELLPVMSRRKLNMSVVTDNFGGTLGIVTVEDILEELVGEIWDEDDVVKEPIVDLGDGCFVVNADESVSDVMERLGYDDPEENEELVNTLMGEWAYEQFTAIPKTGDSFRYHRMEVTVSGMEHNRIMKLKVTLLPENEEGGGEQ